MAVFHFETSCQADPEAVGTMSGLTQASTLIAAVGLRLGESEKYTRSSLPSNEAEVFGSLISAGWPSDTPPE